MLLVSLMSDRRTRICRLDVESSWLENEGLGFRVSGFNV